MFCTLVLLTSLFGTCGFSHLTRPQRDPITFNKWAFRFTHEGVVGSISPWHSSEIRHLNHFLSPHAVLESQTKHSSTEAILGVSKSRSACGERCKLTTFQCHPTRASSGEIGSKAGQAPGVYRSPFPLLDSPYRISSASITTYMHTCLLRATARSLHAALGFWE